MRSCAWPSVVSARRRLSRYSCIRTKIVANEDRFEARGLIVRGGKIMLLRVIYDHGAVVTVIAVVATSKLAKYGVTP